MYPDDVKYTAEHEWVRVLESPAGHVRVGITDFAQDALGDIVYAQLPEVGNTVGAREAMGELESTKSVSDIFAPVSGTVAAVNDALADHPELCNTDPYGDGWIAEIGLSDTTELDGLLDAAGYQATIASD